MKLLKMGDGNWASVEFMVIPVGKGKLLWRWVVRPISGMVWECQNMLNANDSQKSDVDVVVVVVCVCMCVCVLSLGQHPLHQVNPWAR